MRILQLYESLNVDWSFTMPTSTFSELLFFKQTNMNAILDFDEKNKLKHLHFYVFLLDSKLHHFSYFFISFCRENHV